jgi:glycosyltransferase involved in cell wall biosynthesis
VSNGQKRLIVLSILDGFPFGGDENRVLQIAQAIDRERFDFRIATIRPPDPEFDANVGSMRNRFEQTGLPIIDLSVPRKTRGLSPSDLRRHVLRVGSLVRTVARLARYVKQERVDVIDGHHNSGYLAGTLAGVFAGVPSLLTTYNVSEVWEPRWLWKIMHRSTLALSGAVVTDSNAVADVLRSWMSERKRSRVRVIPNGPRAPVAARPEADVRSQLGLPARGQSRVVAQIAALSRGKGQHVLLEAAPRILERHPDVTFLCVGFERPVAGYADVLRSRARELGIADRVIVTSYPGDIGDVWQAVDVQVHPTMQDSLPNTILEGMALGKPVIASAHAGIPDLVLHDRTGIVVPVNNAGAVADAVIRLLDDPQTAQAFGKAARERYAGGFTGEHLVARMQRVFAEVAAKRAP